MVFLAVCAAAGTEVPTMTMPAAAMTNASDTPRKDFIPSRNIRMLCSRHSVAGRVLADPAASRQSPRDSPPVIKVLKKECEAPHIWGRGNGAICAHRTAQADFNVRAGQGRRASYSARRPCDIFQMRPQEAGPRSRVTRPAPQRSAADFNTAQAPAVARVHPAPDQITAAVVHVAAISVGIPVGIGIAITIRISPAVRIWRAET